MSTEVLILAVLWAAWCTLHSVMIAESVTSWAKRTFGDAYRYYRLFFNIIAVITFVLILWYYRSIGGDLLPLWPWPWTVLQAAGVLSGLAFLYFGARIYNQAHFFGIEQIREGIPEEDGAPKKLKTGGILGVVRHPYYTGGLIILLFIGDGSPAASVTQIILMAYLIVGTFLEERKLIHEFGDAYREYMKKVPRFFPRIFNRNK